MDYLPSLARLPDARCGLGWRWDRPGEGELLDVRDGLYRCLEEELQAAAELGEMSEPARLLAGAQEAFGELRGILAAVPPALLDKEPGPGEWSVRQTLRHVLETELSYRVNTLHALGRGPLDPLVVPREQRPQVAIDELGGTLSEVVERIADERRTTDGALGGVPAPLLARPSLWAGFEVDVRFRIGRFAGHLVEHTVQVEKALHGLHHHPGEAALISRRISAARGAHEHRSAPGRLLALDAHHREVLRAALASPAARLPESVQ